MDLHSSLVRPLLQSVHVYVTPPTDCFVITKPPVSRNVSMLHAESGISTRHAVQDSAVCQAADTGMPAHADGVRDGQIAPDSALHPASGPRAVALLGKSAQVPLNSCRIPEEAHTPLVHEECDDLDTSAFSWSTQQLLHLAAGLPRSQQAPALLPCAARWHRAWKNEELAIKMK